MEKVLGVLDVGLEQLDAVEEIVDRIAKTDALGHLSTEPEVGAEGHHAAEAEAQVASGEGATMMRSLGTGIVEFKKGLRGDGGDSDNKSLPDGKSPDPKGD